jgi:hypothetical protein
MDSSIRCHGLRLCIPKVNKYGISLEENPLPGDISPGSRAHVSVMICMHQANQMPARFSEIGDCGESLR